MINSKAPVLKPQDRFQVRHPDKWQCWAHSMKGLRCTNVVKSREGEPIPIPYCDTHLKSGDYAVKVVNHPIAGKCLVARFDLPKNYKLAYFGYRGKCLTSDKEDRAISFYPPDKITGKNKDMHGERIVKYNGVINPSNTGDIVQYAACPGPNERQNMRSTFTYWGTRNCTMGGLEFVTIDPVIKANTQLTHWYGSGWWNSRGIKRVDVGTSKYPGTSRKKRKILSDKN